jgi:hypothetical protein
MYRLAVIKKSFILFTVLSMLLIPIMVEAGGGGCCGGHSKGSTYYPSYYPYTGRVNSALGYPGYGYSSLYSPYSSYGLGNLFGLGGYGYPGSYGGVVTSKDYGVEQSYTTFVPGGAVTTSVSEGTEVSYPYNPWISPYGGGFSYNPYAYGIGASWI